LVHLMSQATILIRHVRACVCERLHEECAVPA